MAFGGDGLLRAEVTADSGTVKGVRPLGGRMAFGETGQTASCRECVEALATKVRSGGDWIAIETIYQHEGHLGNEFTFAAPIELDERALCLADQMTIADSVGVAVGWNRRRSLADRGRALYRDGFADRLVGRWQQIQPSPW